MNLIPSVDQLAKAAANAYDMTFGGGVADLRRTPAAIIDEGPQRTVYRYLPRDEHALRSTPVLLVPPLAGPPICFDLRRGCSLAEHLLAMGHPTYLVDYGAIGFSDRELGLEHWVRDVIPAAVEAVHRDSGGEDIQLVGWCLGGIMSLLAVAARELPVLSLAAIASPFDSREMRMLTPIRHVAALTGGRVLSGLMRALGGAPAPLVGAAFRLTAIDKELTKPIARLRHLDDRDWLAQLEAVDHLMGNMLAYPGRTLLELYHRFFLVNDLAGGTMDLGADTIHLADIRVPVLAVAGETDVLAPCGAVHALGRLLPSSPDVRLETAPGGHLGVLTGRAARRTTWPALDRFLTDAARADEDAAGLAPAA